MEVSAKGYVTVMTPQGEFLKIPWAKSNLPAIGSEIGFAKPIVSGTFFRTHSFSALAASVAIILMFMSLWNFVLIPQSQQVVAYVNVDINPSLELGINKKDKVIEVSGLNKDGEELIKNRELVGLPIKEALEKITVAAIEEDYLSAEKGNTVLITLSSSDVLPDKAKELENEVKDILRNNKITADANALNVPSEVHEQAKEENISTGKYVLYMEAVEQGLDISLDDLREESMKKAVEQAGGVPGRLISEAKKDEKNLREMNKKIKQKKLELQEQKEIRQNEKQAEDVMQESKLNGKGYQIEAAKPQDKIKQNEPAETEAADANVGIDEQSETQELNDQDGQQEENTEKIQKQEAADESPDRNTERNGTDSKNIEKDKDVEKKNGIGESQIIRRIVRFLKLRA